MQILTIVDHPLVQHKLTLMRQKATPSAVFRQLLREIAHLLCYEATRDLPLHDVPIETPLCGMNAPRLAGKKLVLASILRAGNGLLEGMLDLVPSARVCHIGFYRDEKTLQAVQYYFKAPEQLDERLVILLDPMLATANTVTAAIDLLKKKGATRIRFVSLLAAPEGLAALGRAHPDVPVITAAVDERLNASGYIVPGLGDAGDRLFGTG